MKKSSLFIILVATVLWAGAQQDYQNDEIRTVFSKNKSNGGYGAFTVSFSNIGGDPALVTGGRGAFIFDHVLVFGLGGFGFVNNLNYDNFQHDNKLSLAGGYGGFYIEPILGGRSPVHVSFPILIGMGGATLVDLYGWNYWDDPYNGAQLDYDTYFVLEPAMELEFNMARFFRLAANVSYRYTTDIQLLNTSPGALRGFNYGMTFKFGKF